jgi:hypothetical protein
MSTQTMGWKKFKLVIWYSPIKKPLEAVLPATPEDNSSEKK